MAYGGGSLATSPGQGILAPPAEEGGVTGPPGRPRWRTRFRPAVAKIGGGGGGDGESVSAWSLHDQMGSLPKITGSLTHV